MAIFSFALLISTRRIRKYSLLPISVTNELKGFAILAVLFSHIGLFLFPDTKFLYPLSISSGVAVNLFLLLSGYGLTMSTYSYHQRLDHFYLKRLPKLFIPLWISISLFLLLDLFLLNRTYSLNYIIQSYLGYFPGADIHTDLNSPLWYFTLILFYYLLFPLVYLKRPNFYSSLLLVLTPFVLLHNNLVPVTETVLKLYKLHYLAFPIGSTLAIFVHKYHFQISQTWHTFSRQLTNSSFKLILKSTILTILIVIFLDTTIHSGVGQSLSKEQLISIISSLCLLGIFDLINLDFKLFDLFGIYSYEIYLLHWPILSRFDLLYKTLPEFIATLIYLALFILLGLLVQKSLTHPRHLLNFKSRTI